MSYADLEGERPAKKRRFFVEEPEDNPKTNQTSNSEPSRPDEINVLPETHGESRKKQQGNYGNNEGTQRESGDGFDVDLLSAFVGEQLPENMVQKLIELSNNNVQQGLCMTFLEDPA
jgi:hypothetical protein